LSADLAGRAAIFAALGEPVRLAIVDQLMAGDASPGQLAVAVGLGSNLLAHHLGVLDQAGVIRRLRSEGDHRRSYVTLRLDNPAVLAATSIGDPRMRSEDVGRVVFVCTGNSARSQLAAAVWNRLSSIPAASAGTHPARRVHPGAVKVARRHGLDLANATPASIEDVLRGGELIVAVCNNAHEELDATLPRLHWSIPDPVRRATVAAFEDAYTDITRRVQHLAERQPDAQRAS
jgi:protein-tyrosine-phosphatase